MRGLTLDFIPAFLAGIFFALPSSQLDRMALTRRYLSWSVSLCKSSRVRREYGSAPVFLASFLANRGLAAHYHAKQGYCGHSPAMPLHFQRARRHSVFSHFALD